MLAVPRPTSLPGTHPDPRGRTQLTRNHLLRWVQNAFQTVSFSVPNNWKAGRIWVRRAPYERTFCIHAYALSRLVATVTLARTPGRTRAWMEAATAVCCAILTPAL